MKSGLERRFHLLKRKSQKSWIDTGTKEQHLFRSLSANTVEAQPLAESLSAGQHLQSKDTSIGNARITWAHGTAVETVLEYLRTKGRLTQNSQQDG